MVPAVSGRIPPVPPYSGYCSLYSIYAYRIFTFYDATFQMLQLDEYF
jgi:hypothetical protein